MAYAITTYTANGATTQWAVPFPYIARSHVHVYIDDIEDVAITWINDALVQTATTPATGQKVKIHRQTPTEPLVQYLDGAAHTAASLNKAALQALYAIEELQSGLQKALSATSAGDWDARGERITSVGTPIDSTDATTKQWVLSSITASGNITAPEAPEDNGKVVVANGGNFAWTTPTVGLLADAGVAATKDVGGGGDQVSPGNHDHDAAYLAKTTPLVTRIPAGDPLPTSDIGPIYYEAIRAVMTWTTFNTGFSGYASPLLGSYMDFSVPTAPPGWISIGATNLSLTTYAALWNFAQHHGLVVPLGSWQAGYLWYADNGDGTFRIPDIQGLFMRAWPGGAQDPGRLFGVPQGDAMRNIWGEFYVGDVATAASFQILGAGGAFYTIPNENAAYGNAGSSGVFPRTMWARFDASRYVPTAPQNRPVNISLPKALCCL
uniref:Phage T7 tail fibre protein n=1 Tax=Candidatus Kentrum sp. TC TaxID=2126339 RepID=A0A451A9K9_9GAMM|nr:MAG: Phage T7 tail fibre protein [Candidatus Kentron sp. TC]